MRTRTRHHTDESTIFTLATTKNGSTYRALADSLGYPGSYAPTLQKVLAGQPGAVTLEGENILRVRLGLPVIARVEVSACPDCGQAHVGGRCHGQPVAAVVILAPGERVTTEPERKPGKPKARPAAHRPYIRSDAKWRAYQEWSRQWDECASEQAT